MILPSEVKHCIDKIQAKGFEAYVVGGCVRDSLLGKAPKDWDVTTSALPQQIKEIFNHTYDTGIKHGTVTAIVNRTPIEITTYRIESDYKDFRRPSRVSFTDSVCEDLARRDFTINAIAYNDAHGIIDPFGGIEDLNKKIIKGVGNASERFNEDALRMLRALRFSAQLSFGIEHETRKAIDENAALIKHISAERISDELIKLLMSDCPQKISELGNLMQYIFPEISTINNNVLMQLNLSKKIAALRIFILLQELDQCTLNAVLKRLRLDNATFSQIMCLHHRRNERISDQYTAKKLLNAIKPENFDLLLDFWEAEDAANGVEPSINLIREMRDKILGSGHCVYLKELAVKGNDLKQIGVEPREIGSTLSHLLDIVHKKPEYNNREVLIDYILRNENGCGF